MRPARSAAVKPQRQLLNLILSTDYNADVDDVWNVAFAFALHNQGICRLVSIGSNNRRQFTIASIDQMRKAAGVAPIPYWQYNGAAGAQAPLGSREYIHGTSMFDGTFYSGTILGHVAGLRRALASCPDASVIYWNTGQISDLADATVGLLLSGADQYSPLTGRQLVAAKILRAYWAAAWCPQNQTPGDQNGVNTSFAIDPDIAGDKTAAQYLVGSTGGVPNWPPNVPFIWCGEEQANNCVSQAPSNYPSSINPAVDALRMSYGTTGRPLWANPAMIVEFFGGAGMYQINHSGGSMAIDASGNDVWSQTVGSHAYISTINFGASQEAAMVSWFRDFVFPRSGPAATGLPAVHDFSDATAWWEFTNAAKTSGTGATAQVVDSTGNGYTLGVPSTYAGCTFPTGQLNGYQVGRFSSAMMSFDSLAATFAGAAHDIHVFMLVKLTSVTSPAIQVLFDISTGDQTSYAHWQNRLNANIQPTGKFAAGRTTTVATNTYQNGQLFLAVGNWALVELAYSTSPPSGLAASPTAGMGRMLSYVNGAGPTVGGFAADNTAFSWTSGRLMGNPTSSDDSTHMYAAGDVAEVAIYNRVLWSQERAARLNYWNTRYALGLVL